MRRAALLALVASACTPQTALLLDVMGPKTDTASNVVTLELVAAHPSYCQRWVTDHTATGQRFSIGTRDLDKSPLRILVTPDHETDLADPVRALVLGLDASDRAIGVAAFDAHPFRFEKVDEYSAHMSLFGEGARTGGPQYVSSEGCVCVPGQPYIGTGSQTGCDLELPPSFARLTDTAGCELPVGEALPVGVCDGQLYPGELANRGQSCYETRDSMCRLGQRTCSDEEGRALNGECDASNSALALPTGTLCDAFLACQQTPCADPLACLKKSVPVAHRLACTLPVSDMANNGALVLCGNGSVTVGAQTGAACVAAMLDGTQVSATTLGWKADDQDTAQLSSALCPPTLQVDGIALDDPKKLAPSDTFTVSVGDELWTVTLSYTVGCAAATDNDLHCVAN